MKSLIIINNIKEYEQLVKEGYDFTGLTIVTTNIDLYFRHKDEIEVINLWKYLDDDIIFNSEKKACDILKQFKLDKEYSVNFGKTDVFEITKVFLKPFFKSIYNTVSCLNKLLQEFDVGKVIVNEEISIPMQVFFDDNHVLNAVCKDHFSKNNITVESYRLSKVSLKPVLKTYNLDTSQYLFDLEKLTKQNNKQKILVLLSENFEWDFDLTRHLQSKYENIFVILRTPKRNAEKCNKTKIPVFFDDFSMQTDKLQKSIESIDKSLDYFIKFKDVRYSDFPEVFSNNYLNFQFNDFFEREKTYLKVLHTFQNVYDFVKPQKIYFSNSWDLGVRCMAKTAVDSGCSTFLSIHGGVVDNSGYESRVFETSNYFVWGTDNLIGLKEAGQNADSIFITGSMQMDYWNGKITEYKKNGLLNDTTEYDNIYNFKLKKEDKHNKPVITFFTSAGGGFASHNTNEFKHLESIKKVINLANKRVDLEFRIKPHVLFDYHDFWNKMKNEFPDNLKIIEENNLLLACDEMDLGVLLNVISNVAYEISLTGKPLIYLKDAVFDVKCSESTIERSGILCLNSYAEFESYIEKYFGINKSTEPDSELAADLEDRRKRFLDYSLADFSKPVIERIEEIIMKDENGNRHKDELEFDVYTIIEWVSNFIKTNNLKPFPEIKDFNRIPKGEDFINWVYKLTENWCRYFLKEKEMRKYFEKIISKLPAETGVGSKLKIKRKMYAKTRDLYLKYGLNENEKVRRIVKKIF